MPISRVTATWRGFRGAPGYTNLFFRGQNVEEQNLAAMVGAVGTFFGDLSPTLPSDVSISISQTVDQLDEQTGNLVGQEDAPNGLSVTGGSSASYSAASGAVVNWNTSTFISGRRVRGRTFIVPLASSAYDTQGDLTSTALTSLRNAADGLAAGGQDAQLVVWTRPRGGSGGAMHTVTSATVPDLGAILRSRRD